MRPMHFKSLVVVGAAALALSTLRSASAQTITIANGDFESIPTYNQNVYVTFNTTTTTASYTWTGYTGVVPNSNLGFFGEPAAPSGTQVGFLQGYQGVSSNITQTLTGFTIGRQYTISGYGAQRGGTLGGQTFNFSLFGTTQSITPTSSTAFNFFTTGPFTATAASAPLTISTAVFNGDNTAFLDKLTVNAAPEPSSVAELAALALPGLGFLVARRRRNNA